MAVAVHARFRVSPQQYDLVIASLDLDAEPPAGAILHLACEAEVGIEVTEVWQTRESAEAFYEQRLLPAAHRVRVRLEPEVVVMQLHNLFAADLATIERIGSTSLPAFNWATR